MKKEVPERTAVAVVAALVFVVAIAGWYWINREPVRASRSAAPAPPGIRRSTTPGRPNKALPAQHRTLDATD